MLVSYFDRSYYEHLEMTLISVIQIPRKQVVEKPARAIERHVMEIERKNRTYTLLSDSESDGEAVREREKKKSKGRGDKRKHLRKREESQSSSEEETPKR